MDEGQGWMILNVPPLEEPGAEEDSRVSNLEGRKRTHGDIYYHVDMQDSRW